MNKLAHGPSTASRMPDKLPTYPGPIFEYIARARLFRPLLRPPSSPQGRAGRAVYLLLTNGPMRADELTVALGYSSRFGAYALLDNLSQGGVPLCYDEETGLWGILDYQGDGEEA